MAIVIKDLTLVMAAIKESNVLDGRPARAEAKSGSCFYFLEQLGSIWNTLLHPNLAGLLRKWGLPSSSNDEDSAWQLHPIPQAHRAAQHVGSSNRLASQEKN